MHLKIRLLKWRLKETVKKLFLLYNYSGCLSILVYLISFAGLPATTVFASTLFKTTEPAPIIALSLIVILPIITAFAK